MNPLIPSFEVFAVLDRKDSEDWTNDEPVSSLVERKRVVS